MAKEKSIQEIMNQAKEVFQSARKAREEFDKVNNLVVNKNNKSKIDKNR